jgi:4-hydroxy-2-oxoheptanedioate aldolase
MPGDGALIRNPAKEKLTAGGPVVALNVFEALRPALIKLASQLEIDLLLVETEHILHDPETLAGFLLMARDHGLSPTVTIPAVTQPEIGRLLDAGALGFCLCHAESVPQVEALVRAAKYPPWGARALAHGPNADYRMDDAARYCAEANEATLVMLKLETRRGIENAEALMSIEGVDAIVFGPGDLGADMGLHGRWDDPALLAAMEGVVDLALAKGIAVEAAATARDKAEYQRQRARGIRIFGPTRMTDYDHLRRGIALALEPFR